jgi:hypothetical protein
MPMNQPDFFEEKGASVQPYVPDPQHVRNRLVGMLAKMQAAGEWPWDPVMVSLYRETVWPYLFEKLPDQREAAEWRGRFEAEIERLDRRPE